LLSLPSDGAAAWDQLHLPPPSLSMGSGLPRMSGRAVVVGACPGGRQMGPARGCRRVPGKDARDGVAATERHRSGAFSAPRCSHKNGKIDLEVALPALSRPPVRTV
jgi:hypothetical protein